jgi:hypothetical protein
VIRQVIAEAERLSWDPATVRAELAFFERRLEEDEGSQRRSSTVRGRAP